ncbi:MAG: MGMT family protein [Chloroflexi bacterium]|nr:MGMT family protein [Chloroflexota bacterium]
MPKPRKTWRQKLEEEHPEHGKIVNIPPKMQNRFGTGKMLIPKPLDIDALINKVPKGKLVTVTQIRDKLAEDAHADCSCPMTTGIFLRIVAEVAEEDFKSEKGKVTPYWRVIKADGSLNEKFPGGVQAQAAHLKEEGHIIEPNRGKKPPRVKNFEKSLQKL